MGALAAINWIVGEKGAQYIAFWQGLGVTGRFESVRIHYARGFFRFF